MKKSIIIVFMMLPAMHGMEQHIQSNEPTQKPGFFSRLISYISNINTQPQQNTANGLQAFSNPEALSEQQDTLYRTWPPQAQMTLNGYSFCIVTNDDKLIICGNSMGEISIYSYETGIFVADFNTVVSHNQWFAGISPDNKYIFLTDSTQGTVWVYNISDPKDCYLHKKLEGHTCWVKQAKVTGNLVITGSEDATLKLWDLNTTDSNFISSSDTKQHLLLSSNDNYVFSHAPGAGTELWDVSERTLTLKAAVTIECQMPPKIIKIHNKCYLIAIAGRSVSLYPLEDGAPQQVIAQLDHQQANGGIRSSLFLPDLNYLIVGTDEYALYIWNLQDPQNPQLLCEFIVEESEFAITALAVRDNKFLYTGTYQGSIYIWDITNPSQPGLLNKFKAHSPSTRHDPHCGVVTLKIMPNGLLSFGEDGAVKIWHLPDYY